MRKYYIITEHELTNINRYDRNILIYSLITSITLSISIVMILTTVFVEWSDFSSMGQAIMILVPPTFAIMSIMFGWLSFYVYKTKKIMIQHIKEEFTIQEFILRTQSSLEDVDKSFEFSNTLN